MPDFLEDYSPESVAEIAGIPEADIRKAAQWIGEAPEWMSCYGLNQSTHRTWNTNAVCNLHLATGKICRPGSGPFSLTGQPNAMGGREMGYMGSGLPGQQSVLVGSDRAFIEDMWGVRPGTLKTSLGVGLWACSRVWPTERSRLAGSSALTLSRLFPIARRSLPGWKKLSWLLHRMHSGDGN